MDSLPELTSDEENAIAELRKRLKTHLSSNLYEDTLLLYRFLKARDFRMNDAETMLRKHLIWRRVYQIDTYLEDFKKTKFFTKYIEPTVLGFNNEGSLVIHNPTGKIEAKDLFKCIKKHDVMKNLVWCAEFYRSIMFERIAKGENCDRKAILILDFDKLSFGNATSKDAVEIMINITNYYQDNYPEHMKAVYAINAPTYILIGYSILKTIMANATIQKIHVFGRSGWKERLLENIDADILPAFLGGNRTDPDGDPLCKSFVRHGETFAPEYCLSHEERYFSSESDTRFITVPNGQKVEINVGEQNVGSVIHWAFYCKSSISFGLIRETDDRKLEEVIPVVKYDTSDGSEKGSYKVKCKGRYIITFDNLYSWLSSKEIEYCIEVKKMKS